MKAFIIFDIVTKLRSPDKCAVIFSPFIGSIITLSPSIWIDLSICLTNSSLYVDFPVPIGPRIITRVFTPINESVKLSLNLVTHFSKSDSDICFAISIQYIDLLTIVSFLSSVKSSKTQHAVFNIFSKYDFLFVHQNSINLLSRSFTDLDK